jgi:hypothetical protein
MTDLDELLRTPLAEIPDNGFSAAVLVRMEAERTRHHIVLAALAAAAGLFAAIFLPIRQYSDAVLAWLPQETAAFSSKAVVEAWMSSPALTGLAIAAGAILLTFLFDRQVASE